MATGMSSECSASFRSLSTLWRHKLTHTGEKNHMCDQCGNSFLTQSDLKSHKKSHEPSPYPCTEPGCKHSFRTEKSLADHLPIHGPRQIPCPNAGCGFKGTTQGNVDRHSRDCAVGTNTARVLKRRCEVCHRKRMIPQGKTTCNQHSPPRTCIECHEPAEKGRIYEIFDADWCRCKKQQCLPREPCTICGLECVIKLRSPRICVLCYDKSDLQPKRECIECGENKKIIAKDLCMGCNRIIRDSGRKRAVCGGRCGVEEEQIIVAAGMCALCYKHREVTPPAFKSDLSSLRDRLKNRDDMILLDCETLHHPGPLTDKSPQTLIQFALLYKAERLEVIIDHGNGLGQVERLNLLRAMVRPPRQEMGWNHVEMNLKTLCNVLDVKLREFPSKSDVEAFEAALKELDSRLAEKGRSPTDAIDELELWMNIPIENGTWRRKMGPRTNRLTAYLNSQGHNTICYWAATHFDQISLDNWYQSVTDEPVSRWHYDKSILPNVQRSIEKKGENRGSAALHSLYISLVDPTRKIPVSMRWHTALADCLIMKAVLNELWKICGDTQPGQRNMSQTKLKQWWKLT